MMVLPVMEQNEREFGALLDLLHEHNVQSILEIGVFQGGTLARFQHAFPDIPVVGIDPRPMIDTDPQVAPYFGTGICSLVFGSSQDPQVRQRARSNNFGESFDFVFIDGDHTYEGVREDWQWARFEARIVAFHDIHSTHTCPGVVKFWNEMALRSREQEWSRIVTFAEEVGAGRNGIGVVWPR